VISDRMFLEALLYLARTWIPWRKMPEDFRAWDTIYNRYRRWLKCSVPKRLLEQWTAHRQLAAITRMPIDTTNVRAHWCAGGELKKRDEFEQGLGRGVGSQRNIVFTAVDEKTPVDVDVLPGRSHEASHVEKLIDTTKARLPQIQQAVADKGFDGERHGEPFKLGTPSR